MPFSEIAGHARPIESLRAAIRNDRLSHAYLFYGPTGVGKCLTAVSLAKALHCQKKGPADFCGRCPACAMIERRNHPNVCFYEPDPTKRDFTIDKIKELQSEMALAGALPGRRVFILDGAEQLNEFAQNRLLKTLEEPRDEALLILIATHPEALLPTILSRVQCIRFAGLPPEAIEKRLVADAQIHVDQARMISRLCRGSLGRAFELLEEGEIDTGATWVDLFGRLSEMNVDETCQKLIESVGEAAVKGVEGRRRLRELLGLVQDFWHDVLVLGESPEAALLMPGFEEPARALANELDGDAVVRVLEEVQQTRDDLARNAHSQSALMGLVIRCRRIVTGTQNLTLGTHA